MLSINPISFCGRVTRETHLVKAKNSPNGRRRVGATKDQFVRSYDSQIEKIQDYKKYAMQLDNMMHKDPEIKKIIKELPDDMVIEVSGNFHTEGMYDNSTELKLQAPCLLASESPVLDSPKGKKLAESGWYVDEAVYLPLEYDKKGPDKKQIVSWLENLKSFFE